MASLQNIPFLSFLQLRAPQLFIIYLLTVYLVSETKALEKSSYIMFLFICHDVPLCCIHHYKIKLFTCFFMLCF